MLSRGGDVEIEPYYCLPVGTNGVLSAQMAAAVAQAQAQAQAAQGNQVMVGNSSNVGTVAWSQPTSPTPLNRGAFASAAASTLSPTHGTATAAALAAAAAAVGHGGSGGGGGGNNSINASHRLTYPKKNDEGRRFDSCSNNSSSFLLTFPFSAHFLLFLPLLSSWQRCLTAVGWQLALWQRGGATGA